MKNQLRPSPRADTRSSRRGGSLASLALLGSLTGCVAPMALGPAPIELPERKGVIAAATGIGATPSRVQGSAEASARLQLSAPFSVEAGVAMTALRQTFGEDDDVVGASPMPYLRPTIHLGPASIGVAVSGLGAGAGGGGGYWGMISPRVGYSQGDWAVYGAWLRHVASLIGGDSTRVSSEHWRIGGDYFFDADPIRVGLGAGLTLGDERYARGDGGEWDGRFLLAAVRITLMSNPF